MAVPFRMPFGLALLLVALAYSATISAEEPAPSNLARFVEQARSYDIRRQERGAEPALLVHPPVLQWNNPARTGEDGATFVWTDRGQPIAIGSMFRYRVKDTIYTKHEFHSLATGPLTCRVGGETVWKPSSPGIAFAPLPDAPTPALGSKQRTLQMRTFARDFGGILLDEKKERSELRLVPKPIFEYEPTDGEVVQGAIFSHAFGTDPEILIILEAARTAGREPAWRFAIARYHYFDVTATHRGKTVFHRDPDYTQAGHLIGDTAQMDKPYVSFRPRIDPEKVTK